MEWTESRLEVKKYLQILLGPKRVLRNKNVLVSSRWLRTMSISFRSWQRRRSEIFGLVYYAAKASPNPHSQDSQLRKSQDFGFKIFKLTLKIQTQLVWSCSPWDSAQGLNKNGASEAAEKPFKRFLLGDWSEHISTPNLSLAETPPSRQLGCYPRSANSLCNSSFSHLAKYSFHLFSYFSHLAIPPTQVDLTGFVGNFCDWVASAAESPFSAESAHPPMLPFAFLNWQYLSSICNHQREEPPQARAITSALKPKLLVPWFSEFFWIFVDHYFTASPRRSCLPDLSDCKWRRHDSPGSACPSQSCQKSGKSFWFCLLLSLWLCLKKAWYILGNLQFRELM